MTNARSLVISILGAVLSAAPGIYAQDVKPPELTVIVQRRPVIQELKFQPQRLLGLSLGADPVSAPLILCARSFPVPAVSSNWCLITRETSMGVPPDLTSSD